MFHVEQDAQRQEIEANNETPPALYAYTSPVAMQTKTSKQQDNGAVECEPR